jgi:hypothetical protein
MWHGTCMTHWCNPASGSPGPQIRSWDQTQWCAGETSVGPLLNELDLGVSMACQVRSAVGVHSK